MLNIDDSLEQSGSSGGRLSAFRGAAIKARNLVGALTIAGVAVGGAALLVRNAGSVDRFARGRLGFGLIPEQSTEEVVDMVKEKVAYSKDASVALEAIALYSAKEVGANPVTSQVYADAIIDKIDTEPASVDSAVNRLVSFMGGNGYERKLWASIPADTKKRIVHANYTSLFNDDEQQYLALQAHVSFYAFDVRVDNAMQKVKGAVTSGGNKYLAFCEKMQNIPVFRYINKKIDASFYFIFSPFSKKPQISPELQRQQPSGQYNTQAPDPSSGPELANDAYTKELLDSIGKAG